MSLNTCVLDVPNCNSNSIPIDNFCFPYSQTPSPMCTSYDVQSQDLNANVIAISEPVSSVFDCLNQCNQNTNCEGVRYNWDSNQCSLMGQECPPAGCPGGGSGTGVFSVYKKRDGGTANCINIYGPDNFQLMVDTSEGKIEPQVPKIGGTYVGADCRKTLTDKYVDPDGNQPVLNAMYQWCLDNPDIDTCNKLCSMYPNSCPGTRDKNGFIFTGVFFLVLLIFIILLTRLQKYRKLLLIFFIPVLIGLGIASGYTLYDAFAHSNPFPGGKPDYPQGNYPQVQPYPATVMYTCKNSVTDHTCVPDDKGIWFGLKNCEDNCNVSCPVGTLPGPNEKCYQSPPSQNAGCPGCSGSSSCGGYGANYVSTCANCNDDNCQGICVYRGAKVPENAYMCTADSSYPNVSWKECTTPGGCDLANMPCDWSYVNGVCYYADVQDEGCGPGPVTFCTGPTYNYTTNKYE